MINFKESAVTKSMIGSHTTVQIQKKKFKRYKILILLTVKMKELFFLLILIGVAHPYTVSIGTCT